MDWAILEYRNDLICCLVVGEEKGREGKEGRGGKGRGGRQYSILIFLVEGRCNMFSSFNFYSVSAN